MRFEDTGKESDAWKHSPRGIGQPRVNNFATAGCYFLPLDPDGVISRPIRADRDYTLAAVEWLLLRVS